MTPKIERLVGLFKPVAIDYGLDMVATGSNEMPDLELYEYEFRIGDASLTLREEEGTADAVFIINLQGQDWDVPDLLEISYDDFHMEVEKMDSMLQEPYAKDYGLDFLNIVGWLLHASRHLPERNAAAESFGAGAYHVKVKLVIDGDTRETGLWVQATSSEDALQNAKLEVEQAGHRFVDAKVVGFKEEPGEF